jgi:DNA-binding MarR family transcriptional regulator
MLSRPPRRPVKGADLQREDLTARNMYLHINSLSAPNFTECADCLCLASRQAARRITRIFERELRPYGVRATQFTVLVMLSLKGAMTIGELAEALGTERTTLTRNLALIERASWVKIEPGEDDARSRIVTVTDVGRATLARSFPGWRKAQEATAAAIGSDAVSALRGLAHAALH